MGKAGSKEAVEEEPGILDSSGEGDSDLDDLDSVEVSQEARYEPPIDKMLGEDLITSKEMGKIFQLPGSALRVKALEHINLNHANSTYPVRAGEFVIVRGPSGGGKTTLLNLLGLLDRPNGGELRVLGLDVHSETNDRTLASFRLEKIGYVFQTFNLMSAMSAVENVELPMMMLNKIKRKERRRRAVELLRRVGLEDRLEHLPSELSGGEQQRVAIARALSNKPQILLLDEPTGDLDVAATVEIMNLLLEINLEQQTALVMVTHNPDLEAYADRILYVEDGTFTRQVLNKTQSRLSVAEYSSFLEHAERTAVERELPSAVTVT
ncbi:hypothetical protein NDN08_006706 [Rhodosorus marinus]|uniref:Probable ATP-dependent transporter ycf16 n=1 Tax=Rhodosorus marinus TaxID=101924 RepID=A0AAV8UII7_9RHOD|nr:hypothetical protein NDN08_006706 [Rhodosorus marinus]